MQVGLLQPIRYPLCLFARLLDGSCIYTCVCSFVWLLLLLLYLDLYLFVCSGWGNGEFTFLGWVFGLGFCLRFYGGMDLVFGVGYGGFWDGVLMGG